MKSETIFGRSKGITFILEPSVELHMPEEESFPTPLRCIDVVRRTNTSLDVLLGSRIDDYWNVGGDRNQSEPWTGFTQFTVLNDKKGTSGPGVRDKT